MIDKFTYEPGETVFRQETHGEGFHVLLSGAVDVLRNGKVVSTLHAPGSLIGEIGFILGTPRTATVVARTPSVLLRVTGQNLESIVKDHPDITTKMLVTLAKRLTDATAKLDAG